MRSLLFRTDPVLINGATVVVFTKDLDGALPSNLWVENLDLPATLRTKFGSKNANLRFVALAAGTGGNSITVTIVVSASSVFGINTVGNDITITLQGDIGVGSNLGPSGGYINTAAKIMTAINKDTAAGHAGTLIQAELAPGSDGSAMMEAMAQTSLAGGAAAAAVGAAVVEYSPTGVSYPPDRTPNFPGPWITLDSVTFANLGANATAVLGITGDNKSIKGLRLKVSKDATNTHVVATAIVAKKRI